LRNGYSYRLRLSPFIYKARRFTTLLYLLSVYRQARTIQRSFRFRYPKLAGLLQRAISAGAQLYIPWNRIFYDSFPSFASLSRLAIQYQDPSAFISSSAFRFSCYAITRVRISISGGQRRRDASVDPLRTISAVPDTPLPSPYSIPNLVISVVIMAVTEVPGILRFTVPFSDLRTLLSFDSPYTFNFRFASLLRTISAVSIFLYPHLYSIPSPVISVVTLAVTEVPGIYFTLRSPPSIYGSLLSAFRLSNLPLPPPRPVMPVLRR
jgi:hypothetical protein